MKNLFILAVVALVAASCSSQAVEITEPVEAVQNDSTVVDSTYIPTPAQVESVRVQMATPIDSMTLKLQ